MATRTVRLDDEAEQALAEVQRATGLTISQVFKRGVEALRVETKRRVREVRHDVYEQLDLGPGGYGFAPSSDAKHAVRQIIAKKHGR
jgi:hypothetical protein